MKFSSALILSLFSLNSWSEDQKDAKTYQTMDMKQFDGVNAAPPKSKVSFSSTCKDELGRDIKSTELGYTECLGQTKMKAQEQKKK